MRGTPRNNTCLLPISFSRKDYLLEVQLDLVIKIFVKKQGISILPSYRILTERGIYDQIFSRIIKLLLKSLWILTISEIRLEGFTKETLYTK